MKVKLNAGTGIVVKDTDVGIGEYLRLLVGVRVERVLPNGTRSARVLTADASPTCPTCGGDL